MPVISGDICIDDPTSTGRMIELTRDVSRHDGDIVYFDNVFVGSCFDSETVRIKRASEGFHTSSEKQYNEDGTPWLYVSWQNTDRGESIQDVLAFDFSYFMKEDLYREATGDLDKLTEYLFTSQKLDYAEEDIENFKQMWISEISSESNVFLVFLYKNQDNNKDSTALFLPHQEAARYTGPFQIKGEYSMEYMGCNFSAPILDGQQKKEMECARKKWGYLKSKLLCPFL